MTVVPEVRKPGFFSPSQIDPSSAQPVVRISPEAAPVILKLVPEGIVFGRAQDLDGQPISDLTVQLFYFQIMEGRKRWDLMNSTETNEEGEFRIADLRPGRYYLAAGPRSQPTWIGAPGHRARQAAYPPVFYPAVNDLASAAPIDVSPGQQVEADLSLHPEPVFHVSGTILGLPANEGADEVWPRVQVISRANPMLSLPVAAQASNEFRAKVPAGSYMVRADVDTPLGPYRGDTPVTVQSDVAGVNLLVSRVSPIRVEVAVQRTHPPSNPDRQRADPVNLRFLGQGAGWQDRQIASTISVGIPDDILGVAPGVYTVEIRPISHELYVDSAQCGSTDLLSQRLTIGSGPTATIQISLRDDGGTLAGNVLSDGHGASATVLLIPEGTTEQVKAVDAGPSGAFKSPELAPGDYTVLAFDSVAGIEYTNPAVLAAYSGNATHVSVAANGQSRISVNLIRTVK